MQVGAGGDLRRPTAALQQVDTADVDHIEEGGGMAIRIDLRPVGRQEAQPGGGEGGRPTRRRGGPLVGSRAASSSDCASRGSRTEASAARRAASWPRCSTWGSTCCRSRLMTYEVALEDSRRAEFEDYSRGGSWPHPVRGGLALSVERWAAT